MKKTNTWAALPVLAAGTLWGLMGLFVRRLNAAGLGSMEVAELRILTGLVLVGLYLLIARRDLLRVRLRDLWCFFGTGVISLLLFSNCYFTAMRYASLSAAAVLLYTAPAFVMVLSLLLFRERLTARKGAALGLVLGLAVVLLCAAARRTVRDTEDVRMKLNQTCLAALPKVRFKQRGTSGGGGDHVLLRL